jgi:hypothetical protein
MAASAGDEVAAAFHTFLEQPGAPVVTQQLCCEAGRPWRIPVCVRHSGGTSSDPVTPACPPPWYP